MAKQGIFVNTSFDPLITRTIIRRYWWWPVVFTLFFGVFAFFYLRYTKPVYQSSLIMQISDQDQAADIIDFENINSKENQLPAIVELLR